MYLNLFRASNLSCAKYDQRGWKLLERAGETNTDYWMVFAGVIKDDWNGY